MKLNEIYRQIVALDDYTPSKKVDYLFSALVLKAVDPFDSEMLSKRECWCLQRICSHAEYELERYWAKKVIGGDAKLVEFPYYENYSDLTRLELNALASCSDHAHHEVLFVGGGSLPMTAIVLALNHNVQSTVIDYDPTAAKLSSAVIRKLNLGHMIKVICADGSTFTGYNKFNVIFVAALAGASVSEKEGIFSYIQKNISSHCHIIARSSWGKRELLYPPLPRSIYKLFKPLIEISPHNGIVNSVVVFRNDLE